MGEIADQIVEGTLCACGEYIEGDASGHPRFCSKQCEIDYGGAIAEPKANQLHKPFACKSCGRRFTKQVGLNDHMRAMHPKGGQLGTEKKVDV